MSSEFIAGLLKRDKSYTFTHDFELRTVRRAGPQVLQAVFYPRQSQGASVERTFLAKKPRCGINLPRFKFYWSSELKAHFYKLGRVIMGQKSLRCDSRRSVLGSRSFTDLQRHSSNRSRQPKIDRRKLGFGLSQAVQLRQAFSVFDKDKDGTINIKELGVVIRSLGQNPTESEMLQMILEYDRDGDGTIDFDEFMLMMAELLRKQNLHNEIRQSYRVFDREKKGYIHVGDLRYTLMSLGKDLTSEEEIDQLLQHLDTNGDRRISYEQFSNLLCSVMRPESMF